MLLTEKPADSAKTYYFDRAAQDTHSKEPVALFGPNALPLSSTSHLQSRCLLRSLGCLRPTQASSVLPGTAVARHAPPRAHGTHRLPTSGDAGSPQAQLERSAWGCGCSWCMFSFHYGTRKYVEVRDGTRQAGTQVMRASSLD